MTQEIINYLNLNDLAERINANSRLHGFWHILGQASLTEGTQFSATVALMKCMLITTEVAELAEEIRDGRRLNLEHVENELADIIIRTLDLAHMFDVNIHDGVLRKMAINETRPLMHGKKA